MKSRKQIFKLSLQKSNIARLSNSAFIYGGIDDKTSDEKTNSFPKTLPNKMYEGCASTDPFIC